MSAETKSVTRSIDRARDAWEPMPEWVARLARECDRTSQSLAARRIGVSAAVVNQVLGNRYRGRMDLIERKTANVLMGISVDCPFLGKVIPRGDCDEYRARKVPTFSPHALSHWRACQACPHNQTKTKDSGSKEASDA